MPDFIPVQSSTLESYAYDAATQTLTVKFLRSNALYDYYRVPQVVIDEFQKAESKGKFFHKEIRGQFAHEKREAV